MSNYLEHPDIAAALRTGYPGRYTDRRQEPEVPEPIIADYIGDDAYEFIRWAMLRHRDVVDEYIETNRRDYDLYIREVLE
jgi:hypothetical protein